MSKFASRWRRWVFLVPTAALIFARGLDNAENPTGGELFLIAVGCAVAGIAWQLLCRRDLVDRLTYFGAAFTVTAATCLIMATERVTDFPAELAVGIGGVLTGLVYAEQWLRGRTERRRASTEVRDRLPAG